MITRYVITLGAPTGAGGKVTSGSQRETINGVPVALAGDSCACPACQSDGVIGLDGPRLSRTVDGREIALSDDLCLCQCNPPPRLIAAQRFMSQTIDSDWYAGQAAAAAAQAEQLNAAGHAARDADSLPLVLIDPDTNEPFRNRPYRLQLRDGLIEGKTDSQGWTRPLSAAERAGVVTWHVPSDAA